MFSQYSFSNIGHSLCSSQTDTFYLCFAIVINLGQMGHNAGIEGKTKQNRSAPCKKLLNGARLILGTLGSPHEGGAWNGCFY